MAWNGLKGVAGDEMGRRNMTTEVGYWTPENRSNEFRSLKKQSNKHGYGYYEDASYTRLKDVTLSYTFPENWIRKIGMQSLTVYASGRTSIPGQTGQDGTPKPVRMAVARVAGRATTPTHAATYSA